MLFRSPCIPHPETIFENTETFNTSRTIQVDGRCGGVKVGHPESQALQSRMSITLTINLIAHEAHVCMFLSLKTGADLQAPMPQMVATKPYDWTAGRPTLTVWMTLRRTIHSGHPASLPKCTTQSPSRSSRVRIRPHSTPKSLLWR